MASSWARLMPSGACAATVRMTSRRVKVAYCAVSPRSPSSSVGRSTSSRRGCNAACSRAKKDLDAGGIEPHACGALPPLGKEVLGGGDLVLALARRNHRELVSIWGFDAQLALERLDGWARREKSRRCASVMPTMEKQPLPTTVETPSSRTRRPRHSARATAPAAAACWYRASLYSCSSFRRAAAPMSEP